MSQITKDINKITGTIIGISGKLILYALVILLLAEGITRGYAFGHEIFYSTAMEEAPGRDKVLTVPAGQKESETIRTLKDLGLIDNEFAIQIQMKFYEYKVYPGTYTLNTSMTSKEILQKLNEKPEESETDADSPQNAAAEDPGQDAGGGNADAGELDQEAAGGNADAGGQDELSFEDGDALEIEIEIPEGGTQE